MKNAIKLLVPLALVAAIATWYVQRDEGAATDELTAYGTVEATDADLAFQMPGRVLSIAASEGDAVAGGAELARLDTREVEAVLAGARAQVRAAEALLAGLRRGARRQEIASAEAAVRSAGRRATEAGQNAERAERLYGGGAISRQALDQARTAVEVAYAARDQAQEALELLREGPRAETIRTQEALVEQALANVARAEARLAQAVITAPFPGIVTLKHRQPGEVVGAGAPILTLLDPLDRWVRIYVREDQIGRVQLGLAASIVSDTYPDRVYAGRVVFIGSQAEFTPRNVQTTEERIRLVYPVRVRITGDPGFELKPGVPADVTLSASGA